MIDNFMGENTAVMVTAPHIFMALANKFLGATTAR
jgi:hypothetical protein